MNWGESQIAKKQLPLQTKTLSPSPEVPAWLKFWRGVTPWQEEKEQTFPEYMRQITTINPETLPPMQKPTLTPRPGYTPLQETLEGIGRATDWYQQNIVKPIVAYGFSAPKELKGKEVLEWYKNPQRVVQSYEERQLPWGQKGMLETLLDPFMYIPGGQVGKVAKGAEVSRGILKQAAKFAESQLTKGASAETIIKGISRTIPEVEARKIVGGLAGKFAKTAEKIPEVAPKIGGIVPPVQTTETVAQKFTRLVEEQKINRPYVEALKSTELRKRAAEAAKTVDAKIAAGEELTAFEASMAKLKGKIIPEGTPIKDAFKPEEMSQLVRDINSAKLGYFTKLRTWGAFRDFIDGKILQPNQVSLLEDFFGIAIDTMGKPRSKAYQVFLDVINIPKAFLSSWDLSAPLRQGLMFSFTRPREAGRAFADMAKAMFSEKYTQVVDQAIRESPHFPLMEQANLYIAPITQKAISISRREEAFMSRFSKYLGVRFSERAYVTYLNKIRADVFSNIVTKFEQKGTALAEKELKQLARFINVATGRGELGKASPIAAELNTLLFSPRFAVSRFQTPYVYARLPRNLQKEFARDVFGTFGILTSLIGLAALGGAEVELDPRSSDFGKVKMGNTRLDPWGGNQQIARYIAQIITGIRKTTGTKEITSINRADTLYRFIRSKEAPLVGFVHDWLEGKSLIGEELEFTKEGITAMARQRLVPMFIGDMWDALENDGIAGGITALPGALGVGVTSFKPYVATTVSEPPEIQAIRKEIATEKAPTRLQKLNAEIGDAQFTESFGFFERNYKDKVAQEVASPGYKVLSNEDKTSRLNSLRSDAVDEMILKYQKTEIVKPPSLQTQLNHAFYQVENNLWAQYPSSLKQLSDQIIKLENSDNRNDKIQARNLLVQHPEILAIRRKIAMEKARIKREIAIQSRR